MTFVEMQTRVAERVGIADYTGGVAGPPTGTEDLDLVKRALHDAERELWRAVDPRTGKAVRWTFQTPILELTLDPDADTALTINDDSTRYRLPRGVYSAPIGRVSWRDGSVGGRVQDTSIDRIIRMSSERPAEVGPPLYCAVWASPDAATGIGQRPQMELRVFPKPSREFTLSARFKMEPIKLVNDGDRPNRPPAHDLTVVARAAALIAAHGGTPNAKDRESLNAEADKQLVASIEYDNDLKPNSLGQLGDRTGSSNDLTPSFVTTDGTTVSFEV